MSSKRVCQIIKLKPQHVQAYKDIHSSEKAWPSVLATLAKAHIVDYSIHYYDPSCTPTPLLSSPSTQYTPSTSIEPTPTHLLIATFKYTGTDFEADMRLIAEDPDTQRWWAITDGMQESMIPGAVGSGRDGGWWLDLPEVFRFDGESST